MPGPEPTDLATTVARLLDLLLDQPDVTEFLDGLARLAVSVAPGSHCGVTLRHDGRHTTVASSDVLAGTLDEIQYLRGRGPCLEATRTGVRVDVDDMAAETRWDGYSARATAHGIGSAVSVPLTIEQETLGALNLYAAQPHAFGADDVARIEAFATQAANALTLLLRHARHSVLDEELVQAVATRALIDQAIGILMATRHLDAREAFEVLRTSSQATNRKVSVVAAELIETVTGRPPSPSRPLGLRDHPSPRPRANRPPPPTAPHD